RNLLGIGMCGKPRHHDSKKQVPIASSEKLDGTSATRLGRIPQSGLVQSCFHAFVLSRIRAFTHSCFHAFVLSRIRADDCAGAAHRVFRPPLYPVPVVLACSLAWALARQHDISPAFVLARTTYCQ